MHPERAARLLATLGLILITAAFALRGLSLAASLYEAPAAFAPAAAPATLPARGHFTLSPDQQQVYFEQQINSGGDTAWFGLPLEGGPAGPAQLPKAETGAFLIRDTMIFVQAESGNSLISGAPAHTRITAHALAPNGKALAFSALRESAAESAAAESADAASADGILEPSRGGSAPTPAATPGAGAQTGAISGQWGLYVLDTHAKLNWLGDFDSLADLAWSPDAQSLAFVAPINGTDQVFSIQASGQNLREITSDASRKSNPVWSPDGQSIAYIASLEPGALNHDAATATPAALDPLPEGSAGAAAVSPAVANSEIYQINVTSESATPRQLTHDPRREYSLAWVKTAQADWLTYAVRHPDQPQISDLLAIDPLTDQIHQVYPPLAIQTLDCPARIPANGSSSVHFTLTNNGLGPAEAPLELLSGPQALPLGMADQKRTPQYAQIITIQPGETKALYWPVNAAPGLATHVTVQIVQTGLPPMAEQHCQMLNSRLRILPNLRFLAPPVLLIHVGMSLCLPWLRQPHHSKQRSRLLWTAWAAAPVVLLVLIIIESFVAS